MITNQQVLEISERVVKNELAINQKQNTITSESDILTQSGKTERFVKKAMEELIATAQQQVAPLIADIESDSKILEQWRPFLENKLSYMAHMPLGTYAPGVEVNVYQESLHYVALDTKFKGMTTDQLSHEAALAKLENKPAVLAMIVHENGKRDKPAHISIEDVNIPDREHKISLMNKTRTSRNNAILNWKKLQGASTLSLTTDRLNAARGHLI